MRLGPLPLAISCNASERPADAHRWQNTSDARVYLREPDLRLDVPPKSCKKTGLKTAVFQLLCPTRAT